MPRPPSPLWAHFIKVAPNKRATCKYCDLNMCGLVIRMRKHLARTCTKCPEHIKLHLLIDDCKWSNLKAHADGEEDSEDNGNIFGQDDATHNFNGALDKADEPVQFERNTTEALLKQQEIYTYKQQAIELPADYARAIDREYRTRCLAHGVPWESSENDRRMFIDTVLNNCMGPINDELFAKFDWDAYQRERLQLYTEVEIKAQGIIGVGKADYVVKRGNKIVVVNEAKRSDLAQGKHQNLAAMEAVRSINKKGKPMYSMIKGICTDFQTWVFLSREGGSIRSDRASVLTGNDSDFSVPGNLHTVVNKIYGMLLEVMMPDDNDPE